STDGGTTWESLRINEKVSLGGVNKYGPTYHEFIITDYVANASNASIRFRWLCTDTNVQYGSGYGWQIDDIAIVETPEVDLKLKQCNMSYFSYGDYADPAYAAYNVYQISGYYGNIPLAQLDSDYANAWFNIIVENKGVNTLTPKTKVEVFNPEMTSIFSNIVDGMEIATNAIDTVDLVETEFAMSSDLIIGKYTVVYSVTADGFEDANLDDNVDTAYFYITENVFSRDVEMPDNRHSLNNSSLGGIDTEQFGHTFMFLNSAEITSVDVFIDENTTPSTAFILHAYYYNSGTSLWEELSASTLIFIEEENLGHWLNVVFTDSFEVTVDPTEGSNEILVTLEMYYNGDDNEIWIGYDKYRYVDGPYNHGFYTKYTSEPDTWYYGGLDGGLSLRLNFNDYTITNSEMPVVERNINIYPNPTYGTLNIENVEGCNIQILNMMGQVVENIEKARMVNSVDMSRYANGTYFVKVINGNEVSTHKVNLMK
ncbi:MAG TPA: T9SS type A sorting domain-containing protein, partial [Bacteroidales bacterium]|nr:T9SS type A sorting domain-containing protein [Bacteroidales bacterium]